MRGIKYSHLIVEVVGCWVLVREIPSHISELSGIVSVLCILRKDSKCSLACLLDFWNTDPQKVWSPVKNNWINQKVLEVDKMSYLLHIASIIASYQAPRIFKLCFYCNFFTFQLSHVFLLEFLEKEENSIRNWKIGFTPC